MRSDGSKGRRSEGTDDRRSRESPGLEKIEASPHRLDRTPDAMGVRRQTVEHPFGTLKSWMGSTHFLTRTLEKVRTEMSLHVLAYNMKRVIAILGVSPLIEAIRA
jgi:transposase